MLRLLNSPPIEVLQRFDRLSDLEPSDLVRLAERLHLFEAPRGTRLLELGSNEDNTLYLVDGEVELLAQDGNRRTLRAGEPGARRPLSRLRPSQYRVSALGNVRFLKIENDLLETFLHLEEASSMLVEDSYSVDESTLYLGTENPLMSRVYEELQRGRLVVPSLPSVAERIGQATLNAGQDMRRLARALMVDPAIAAKIIRSVNTELAPHQLPVNTCSEAVSRLGADKTVSLVVNCVLRETLHRPQRFIAERMRAWWERSLRVSAISFVLARLSERFDPEFAALAGLLHRIGEAVLLSYANEMPGELSEQELDRTIADNANEIGRILFGMWNLSPELVTVVKDAGNMMRQHPHAADYADIVVVAERHADIGARRPGCGPAPDQMPAFQRLGLGDVSPEFSLRIVEAANGALAEADAMLAA